MNSLKVLGLSVEGFNHSPVDDAMPERLPQARLTRTVESLGLRSKQIMNHFTMQTKYGERKHQNMKHSIDILKGNFKSLHNEVLPL